MLVEEALFPLLLCVNRRFHPLLLFSVCEGSAFMDVLLFFFFFFMSCFVVFAVRFEKKNTTKKKKGNQC